MMNDVKNADVIERLRKPFATNKIKKNFQGFDYVPPEHVIDRLNDVLGVSWSFEIVSMELIATGRNDGGKFGGEVIVTGRMEIADSVRQGIGTDQVIYETNKGVEIPDPVGNAYKSAASNCLKLCARLFGVANHLWGGDLIPETATNTHEPEQPASSTSASKPEPTNGKGADVLPATKPQVRKIEHLMGIKEMPQTYASKISEMLMSPDPPRAGWDAQWQISKAEASKVIDALLALPDHALDALEDQDDNDDLPF